MGTNLREVERDGTISAAMTYSETARGQGSGNSSVIGFNFRPC